MPDSEEPVLQPWDRQPGERHYNRFRAFLLMDDRSIQAAYRVEKGLPPAGSRDSVPSWYRQMAAKWEWIERARLWDNWQLHEAERLAQEKLADRIEKLALRRMDAREEAISDAKELREYVHKLLAFPIETTVRREGKEGKDEVVVYPARWNAGHIVKGLEVVYLLIKQATEDVPDDVKKKIAETGGDLTPPVYTEADIEAAKRTVDVINEAFRREELFKRVQEHITTLTPDELARLATPPDGTPSLGVEDAGER